MMWTIVILLAQMVKNLPAIQETWVRSLGWEDSLEKEWQPTPVFLSGKNPMDRAGWQATVHGVTKIQIQLLHFTTPTVVAGPWWAGSDQADSVMVGPWLVSKHLVHGLPLASGLG